MSRLFPQDSQEERILAMGAIYLEEHGLVEALYHELQAELAEYPNLSEDSKEFINQNLKEAFFRLDMNFSEELRPDCLDLLHEMWNVADRPSALQSLQALHKQGHRHKFNHLVKHTSDLYKFKEIFKFDFDESLEIQLSDEEFEKLAVWIEKAHAYVPQVGILAWDVSRFVHLLRMCYFVGFLSEQEAWQKLNEFAAEVSHSFSSWNEFAQSFLIGRTFWAGNEDPEIKSVCERLLGNPVSPWLYCPIKG